ncbi:MAG: hypothetical protein HY602_01210, partial [Parcubacteria group bacterium]|nr:hypothetical protein [Parcubacteria group bacterium]
MEKEQLVIFYHGLWGTAKLFNDLTAYIQERYKTESRPEKLILKALNFEEDDRPKTLNDWFERSTELTRKIIDEHGGAQITLVGASLGGLTVASIIENFFEKIHKAILISPPAPAGIASVRTIPHLQTVTDIWRKICFGQPTTISDFWRLYDDPCAIDPTLYTSDCGYILFDLIVRKPRIQWHLLRRINGYILGGANDRVVPPRIARQYAQKS